MSTEAGRSALAPVKFRVIREGSTHPPCPPSPSPQPEVPLSDTHRPIPLCLDGALIVGAVVEGRAHCPCPPSKPPVDWPARQHSPCPGGAAYNCHAPRILWLACPFSEPGGITPSTLASESPACSAQHGPTTATAPARGGSEATWPGNRPFVNTVLSRRGPAMPLPCPPL